MSSFLLAQHRAIARLKCREKGQHAGHVFLDGQLFVKVKEQMIDCKWEVLLTEVGDQFDGVVTKGLNLTVYALVEIPCADVSFQRIPFVVSPIGERAFDLFAYDEVGRIRMPVEKLDTSIEAVVVRNADQVHAAPLRGVVDSFRVAVGVPGAEEAKSRGVCRVIRMDVEVGLHSRPSHRGFRICIWTTSDPEPA